jgi:hypothetical protein
MEEKRSGRISFVGAYQCSTRAACDLVREKLTLLPAASNHMKLVLTSLLFVVVSALSAPAVELFRYRYHAEDGREFEYVFETDEQSAQKTVSEEKAVESAADLMTSF